jgi:hypothetical protein
MTFNGLKEQTTADFKYKLREADCHGRLTEPYFPWQQSSRDVHNER